MPASEKSVAYVYVRHNKEWRQDLPPAEQIAICTGYLRMVRFKGDVEVFEDAWRAGPHWATKRPGYSTMWAKAEEEITESTKFILIVAYPQVFCGLDDFMDAAARAIEMNGRFIVVDFQGCAMDFSSPLGKNALLMLEPFIFLAYKNKYCESKIYKQIRKGDDLADKVREVPYGYSRVRGEQGEWTIVENEGEKESIKEIMRLFRMGLNSRKIKVMLNRPEKRERFPPRGQLWHYATISRIIARELASEDIRTAVGPLDQDSISGALHQ